MNKCPYCKQVILAKVKCPGCDKAEYAFEQEASADALQQRRLSAFDRCFGLSVNRAGQATARAGTSMWNPVKNYPPDYKGPTILCVWGIAQPYLNDTVTALEERSVKQ